MSPIYVPGKVVLRKDYIPLDASYNNVSLLLHGDGPNGSTVFTDNSPSPKAVSGAGTAQASTTQSKFGGSSIALLTTGRLTIPVNNGFSFATGDYTVEAWLYQVSNSGYQTIFASGPPLDITGSGNMAMYINGGSSLEIFDAGIGPAKVNVSITTSINQWFLLSVSRASGVTRVFINGVLAGSQSDTFSYGSVANANGSSASIGSDRPTTQLFPFNGYIDDFRITKGVARYTANFTPPTQPFPNGVNG